MIEARERMGMDTQALAVKSGCSEELIVHIESAGYITHPHIACRIVRTLKKGVKQYNELVHEDHRKDKLPKWQDPPSKTPGDLRKFLEFK